MKGTLRYFILIFFSLSPLLSSEMKDVKTFQALNLDASLKKKILEGELVAVSEVSDYQKDLLKYQRLNFYVTGLHQKNCSFALVKLSQYENYKNYLNFISISKFDEVKERIHLLLESSILPTRMILNFKIPRINKEGVYPYEFDQGFLKGLKGTISVSTHKDRCFFYTDAYFDGPHTGYPNFVFEFFSQTLSKMAIQSLFRISQTLK